MTPVPPPFTLAAATVRSAGLDAAVDTAVIERRTAVTAAMPRATLALTRRRRRIRDPQSCPSGVGWSLLDRVARWQLSRFIDLVVRALDAVRGIGRRPAGADDVELSVTSATGAQTSITIFPRAWPWPRYRNPSVASPRPNRRSITERRRPSCIISASRMRSSVPTFAMKNFTV